MAYIKRNCNYQPCSKEYMADERNLNRGWGLCCSKSCAAKLRETSRPDYNPVTVARNNRIRENKMTIEDWESLPLERQMYLNRKLFQQDAPNVYGGSGRITGITTEGYRIMDGIAYDEWDEPVYNYDPNEEDDTFEDQE